MHVADLFLEVLEFAAGADNVVEEVPDFSLEKVLFESITVEYLGLEYEFVVVVGQLA